MSTPDVPTRLPGIGTKLDLRDDDGKPIAVIRRLDGFVELYQGDRPLVRLDEATADSLGAFLGGHVSVPAELTERMAGVLGGLELDWVRLPATAHAAGRSVGELPGAAAHGGDDRGRAAGLGPHRRRRPGHRAPRR